MRGSRAKKLRKHVDQMIADGRISSDQVKDIQYREYKTVQIPCTNPKQLAAGNMVSRRVELGDCRRRLYKIIKRNYTNWYRNNNNLRFI